MPEKLALRADQFAGSGSVRPEIVKDATDEYFTAQDTSSQWLEMRCIVDRGNPYREATTKELSDSWSKYAIGNNEAVGSLKAFSESFEKRGFKKLLNVPTGLGTRARDFAGVEVHPDHSVGGSGGDDAD